MSWRGDEEAPGGYSSLAKISALALDEQAPRGIVGYANLRVLRTQCSSPARARRKAKRETENGVSAPWRVQLCGVVCGGNYTCCTDFIFVLRITLDTAKAVCEPSRAMHAMFESEQGTTQTKKSPRIWGDFLVARPGGFEPSTYRFVAGHSIH